MKNVLIMQENEFSGIISIYPSTMQPLCRPTHVDKLGTSNFQICFPAPYLSLHAKYSHCRTSHRTAGCFDDRLLTMMTDTGLYVPCRVGYNFRLAKLLEKPSGTLR